MKCRNCGKVISLRAKFCAYCGAKVEKPWDNLPQGLERARLIVESIEGIDPAIKDLVIGLWRWGVETIMSCEGHIDSLPYPWVTIPLSQVEKATRLVAEWNYGRVGSPKAKVIWVIRPAYGPYIQPEEKLPLPELQKEAKAFGKWLQNLPDNYFSRGK